MPHLLNELVFWCRLEILSRDLSECLHVPALREQYNNPEFNVALILEGSNE
jgi:hypothetical protein